MITPFALFVPAPEKTGNKHQSAWGSFYDERGRKTNVLICISTERRRGQRFLSLPTKNTLLGKSPAGFISQIAVPPTVSLKQKSASRSGYKPNTALYRFMLESCSRYSYLMSLV